MGNKLYIWKGLLWALDLHEEIKYIFFNINTDDENLLKGDQYLAIVLKQYFLINFVNEKFR